MKITFTVLPFIVEHNITNVLSYTRNVQHAIWIVISTFVFILQHTRWPSLSASNQQEKDAEKFIFIGLILNPNYICCCVSLLLGHLSSFRLHKTIFTISISFLNSHRFVFISKSDYLPVTCKKCMCNVMFLKYNTDLILISHIWLPKIPRTKLVIYLEKRVLLV